MPRVSPRDPRQEKLLIPDRSSGFYAAISYGRRTWLNMHMLIRMHISAPVIAAKFRITVLLYSAGSINMHL